MRNIRRREKGFTLAEVLVVLAITLILMAAMRPSYYQYQASTRVRNAIRATLVLKTAINDMANSCKGFPIREELGTDAASLNEFRPLVDLTECGRTDDINEVAVKVYPAKTDCSHISLGQMILPSHPFTANFAPSALCASVCDIEDGQCVGTTGTNFRGMFIYDSTANEDVFQTCSPEYSGAVGPDFPGNYRPGWNYALLESPNPYDKPVGVICSVALGYQRSVLIVVNTSGYYAGSIEEGTGIKDILGNNLPGGGCPCGPYCEERFDTRGDGESGCCSPCVDSSGTKHPGVGYKF